MKELKELTRENVWNLAPYSCARNEFSGRNASVYLDANENPYNSPFNRYPDPLQLEVKKQLAKVSKCLRNQSSLEMVAMSLST